MQLSAYDASYIQGRPLDDELIRRMLSEIRHLLEAKECPNLRIEKIAGAVGCSKKAIYCMGPCKAELVAVATLDGIDYGPTSDSGDIIEDLSGRARQHLSNFRQDNPVSTRRRHQGVNPRWRLLGRTRMWNRR